MTRSADWGGNRGCRPSPLRGAGQARLPAPSSPTQDGGPCAPLGPAATHWGRRSRRHHPGETAWQESGAAPAGDRQVRAGRAAGGRRGAPGEPSAEGLPELPVFLEELVGLAEAVVQQHVDASQRQLRVLDGQRGFPVLPPRRRLLRAGHDDKEAAGPRRLPLTYLPTYLLASPPSPLPPPCREARCWLGVRGGKTRGHRVPAEARTRYPPPGRTLPTRPPALR